MIEQLWLDEEEFEPIETTVMVEVCLEPSFECEDQPIDPGKLFNFYMGC